MWQVVKLGPHLIHMLSNQVTLCLLLIRGDEPTTDKTTLAGTSCARLLVLFQTSANHLRVTPATINSNVVHKTSDEAILTRDERLLSAQRTGLEMRDARRAEDAAAFGAFARTRAEFGTHRAFEFVFQIHIRDVLLSLNTKQ